MMQFFEGKTAIVTGSATGLGAEVAYKLAARGVRVAINCTKSIKEAQQTIARCTEAGGEALLMRGDVGDDVQCRRIVSRTIEKWGRLDILVNNAGTTKFANHKDLDALSAQDFLDLYKINVAAPYQMIRAAAPHMKKQGMGAVVNISSIAGVSGIGSSIAYAASKGALNTMTLSLARALAPEIRVNAVCPGFIGTRWFRDRFDEKTYAGLVKMQEETTPLKQAGTPDLVSDAVLFLCGEGARHITGETLLSDAGMHLSLTPFARR